MFRGGLLPELPDWFGNLSLGDWPLFILLAQFGRIGFINEMMGVYRMHEFSAWFKRCPVQKMKDIIKMLQTINQYLGFRYEKQIKRTIAWRYFQLAYGYGTKREYGNAIANMKKGAQQFVT